MALQKILQPILIAAVAFSACELNAQSNKLTIDTAASENKFSNKKQKWVLAGSIVTYTGLTAGLYSSWYRGYKFKGFHFVNDNTDWLQVDRPAMPGAATSRAVSIFRYGNTPELNTKKQCGLED